MAVKNYQKNSIVLLKNLIRKEAKIANRFAKQGNIEMYGFCYSNAIAKIDCAFELGVINEHQHSLLFHFVTRGF